MYSKMPTHPYIVYIRIFLYFYIFIFLLTIYDMIREPGIFNIIYSYKMIFLYVKFILDYTILII
jgi:hypothetical protein